MVLVHGFACAPNVWFKVRKRLSERFELHLVTLPGCGGAPKVNAPVMPKMIDAISQYCSSLDRPILIGHSIGGTLTLGVASQYPDAVKGAVVIDGLPYFATVFDVNATPDSMARRAEQSRDEIMNAPPPTPGTRTYFDEHIVDPADAAYMNETTRPADRTTMAHLRFESLTTDLRPEMPNIKVPVLAIAAGQPWLKTAEDLAPIRQGSLDRLGEIADLELQIAERARHFVMIDDPDWFLGKVADFVARRIGEDWP